MASHRKFGRILRRFSLARPVRGLCHPKRSMPELASGITGLKALLSK
jgi:hypothetical protein